MQKDALGKPRQRSKSVVSCGVNDPCPNRETYRAISQTECRVFCTNPPRFCNELFARQSSRLPCCGDTEAVIDPLEKFRSVDSATRDLEDRLRPYAAPRIDLFDGSVCVNLREGQPPEVVHLGRKVCDLAHQILKEDEKAKSP
jgi:hypothetical protein